MSNAPPAYRGLDRVVARTRIVADLEASGLIERVEPHQLTVPRGDRSNAVLEPLLTDQWFVDIKPLATPAIRAVEEGRIRFIPEQLVSRLLRMDAQHQGLVHQPATLVGAPDSRMVRRGGPVLRRAQRSGSAHGARHRTRPVAAAAGRGRPRHLVLLGAVALLHARVARETRELRTYYPTSVLVTGFDIIFFWVARMIMMGLKFTRKFRFARCMCTA